MEPSGKPLKVLKSSTRKVRFEPFSGVRRETHCAEFIKKYFMIDGTKTFWKVINPFHPTGFLYTLKISETFGFLMFPGSIPKEK